MQLRSASEEDALLISHLINASWRNAYHGIIDPAYLSRLPDAYWLPSMRAWLSSGRMFGYIAEANDTPIGCVIYGRGRDESHADWGEIVALYLLPEAMGQGYGHTLLSAALDALHADGYDRIYLWAIAEYTHGLRFYQRHGFRITGESVAYTLGSSAVNDVRLVLEEQHR